MDSRARLRLTRWVAVAGLSVAGSSLVGCGSADSGPVTAGTGGGAPADATGGAAAASGGRTGATGSGGIPGSGGVASVGTGGVTQTGGSSATSTGGAAGGANGAAGRAGTGGAAAAPGGRGGSSSSAGGAAQGTGGVRGTGGAGPAAGGAGGNITVWLAGDSTVARGSAPCPIGWGASFMQTFDSRVTVTNNAAGGTSLHTWLYDVAATLDATGECALARDAAGAPTVQARWQAMLTGMKAGDYLFIQFGINDGGVPSSATKGCPRYEGDAAFKTSLGMMAQAAKDRGAHPVFVTPVSSIRCTGSTAVGTRGRFVDDTIAAGTQYDVPVLNLHMLSVAHYTASGFCPLPGGAADVSATTGGAVGAFFCDDHTHFSAAGAVDIAQLVVDGIRGLNLPLATYLR